MNDKITVSTPSRLCLFGEHLDYLGLEVIAVAINLRFSAIARERGDNIIHIKIRDSSIDTLGVDNSGGLYDEYSFDLSRPITYDNNRDYLKSSINVLLKNGYSLRGLDIVMDSEIPIGKGMCSSSTMIVVLIKALLESIGHEDRNNREKIAYLSFSAEVLEFGEPGGMMDHYTSALGGLVNLSFKGGSTSIFPINRQLGGKFILFDSLTQKDTTTVLANAKEPVLHALKMLEGHGISDVRDFLNGENDIYMQELEPFYKKALRAAVDNYKILLCAKQLLSESEPCAKELGELIYKHHQNLRDGLGISTDVIERILDTAMAHGAYGGKVNGSGGGGCCFVYADEKDCEKIIAAVAQLGFPAQVVNQDTGVRVGL